MRLHRHYQKKIVLLKMLVHICIVRASHKIKIPSKLGLFNIEILFQYSWVIHHDFSALRREE